MFFLRFVHLYLSDVAVMMRMLRTRLLRENYKYGKRTVMTRTIPFKIVTTYIIIGMIMLAKVPLMCLTKGEKGNSFTN